MATVASYAVTAMGHRGCPCQAVWLPALEHEATRRGLLRGPLPVSQLIGGAPESGGTHTTGGAADFYPLTVIADVDAFVELAREMGADATWERPFNWDNAGGVRHVHSVLRDCPHNGPARYQYDSTTQGVDHGRDGLSHGFRGAPDTGPRPLSGRTWREGIEWAKQQEENDDMTPDQAATLVRIERKLDKFRTASAARAKQTRGLLAQLTELETTGATAAQVRRLRADVQALAAADTDDDEA